jgi:putative ABC transport system substrate-binding protein
VGYLDDGPAEGFVFWQVVFREGLAELDYFEGCNVAIESHYARLLYWASDLVDRGVAVLVASGSVEAILAVKAATTTIPIVFGFGADPIETGLVSSLDHPGGNITGITSMTTSTGTKRLGLLRDLLPRATRVAVLVDPNDDATVVKSIIADVRGAARSIGREIEVFYAPGVKHAALMFNPDTISGGGSRYLAVFEAAARSLKVEPTIAPVHSDAEIKTVMVSLGREPGGGLVVSTDPFMFDHRTPTILLAAQNNLPAVYWNDVFIKDGGLLSYAPDVRDGYRRSASYVDRILHGAKPADIPVQLPVTFKMVINLKTAKALGLAVPETLLATADEVIQ